MIDDQPDKNPATIGHDDTWMSLALKREAPGWWFHPNGATREAWKRVTDEARAIFGGQHGQ